MQCLKFKFRYRALANYDQIIDEKVCDRVDSNPYVDFIVCNGNISTNIDHLFLDVCISCAGTWMICWKFVNFIFSSRGIRTRRTQMFTFMY